MARLKLSLGSCSFTRCWNVRGRWRCPAKTVQSARQLSIISSPERPWRQDCYIIILQHYRWPHAGRRRRYSWVDVLAVGTLYGAGTGQHKRPPAASLPSPFSEDSCASNQRHLIPMLFKRKSFEYICLQGWGEGDWTKMLSIQLYTMVTGHITYSAAICPI